MADTEPAPLLVPGVHVDETAGEDDDALESPLDDDPELSMRRFRDNIHGYIPVSQRICDIIDTEQFQRLKKIKQLGTSYYVWPGASHNRFEHCLGVAHLAREMATRLQQRQPALRITDRDVECVQIAGLCHDLGHGPWSHVWDSMFIPKALVGEKWQHEDASEMMFDALLLSKPSIGLPEKDVKFVKALIAGEPGRADADEKRFLFDIVANKTNGIDVDKFDYIARDYRAIGEQTNTSFLRLINSARVVKGAICYALKDAPLVYGLCQTRFWLHKTYYSHKTARAVEYMIVDALLAAEPHLKIAERIRDPARFLHLTDSIMDRIQESTEPELAESRAIFHRLVTRDLYRLVDYTLVAWEARGMLGEAVTPEAIVAAVKARFAGGSALPAGVAPALVAALTPRAVLVDVTSIHYGMKAANPLATVRFYSKQHPHGALAVDGAHFSTSLPAQFAEASLRVYTRDARFFGLVQAGFRAVLSAVPGFAPGADDAAVTMTTPPSTQDATAAGPARTPRTASLASLPPPPGTPPTLGGSAGGETPKIVFNPLTTVPPNYPPTSPSGTKRTRTVSAASAGAAREAKRRG